MKPLPHFVQSPLLRSVPGVYHAFLGVDPVEGRGRPERLREVFSLAPETIGTLKQVHSASVLAFEPGDGDVPGGWKREGDALWTEVPGTGVGVHSADCVPILLAHRKIPVVVAVHAGWRGLAAGIVEQTVRVLAARFGDAVVAGIVAVAGPCARACCYEVGEETAEALHGLPGGGGSFAPEGGESAGEMDRRPPGDRHRGAPCRRDSRRTSGGGGALHDLLHPFPLLPPGKIDDRPTNEFSLHQGLTKGSFLSYLMASGADQRTFGDNPLPFGVPSERFSTTLKTVVSICRRRIPMFPGERA